MKLSPTVLLLLVGAYFFMQKNKSTATQIPPLTLPMGV